MKQINKIEPNQLVRCLSQYNKQDQEQKGSVKQMKLVSKTRYDFIE